MNDDAIHIGDYAVTPEGFRFRVKDIVMRDEPIAILEMGPVWNYATGDWLLTDLKRSAKR